jgi:hypothetical protein
MAVTRDGCRLVALQVGSLIDPDGIRGRDLERPKIL